MKVIIAGSRSITDEQELFKALKQHPLDITEVVSGGAAGVDSLGETHAKCLGLELTVFKAKWDLWGRKAGIIRNLDMANYADALLAVWDGKSRGTKHMIETMEKLGKPVYVYIGV